MATDSILGNLATQLTAAAQLDALNTIYTRLGSQATAAKQDTGNTSLSSIDSKTPALVSGAVPVTLPSAQVTALTPPAAITGYATSAKQDTELASLATIAGQVVDLTTSGAITTQNLVPAGTATAGSAVALNVLGRDTLTVQVTGTYTGALSLQGTLDGTTWQTLGGLPIYNMGNGASIATIPTAAPGLYQVGVGALAQVRVTALAAVTGTATLTLRAVDGNSLVALDAAIPAGANTIGSVQAITNNVNTVETAAPTLTTAPTSVTVTTATQVAAVLTTRKAVTICNNSAVPVCIAFGSTVSTTVYTFKIAAGQDRTIQREVWSGVIFGIAESGTATVLVTVTS